MVINDSKLVKIFENYITYIKTLNKHREKISNIYSLYLFVLKLNKKIVQ